MEKLVTIKFGLGSLETGFSIIVQIGESKEWPAVEETGSLPPTPELQNTYRQWQVAYRQLGLPYRLEKGLATNISRVNDCREIAQQLSQQFNQWLRTESFRPLQEKFLEKLNSTDTIRFIVQARQTEVQGLPWSSWEICDRYPKAEIALGASSFEQMHQSLSSKQKVRVLAIVGNSQGIDVKTDRELLNHLPDAEVKVLDEPDRVTLNTYLWDPKGWDILFFAGHSSSQPISDTENIGKIFINPTDSLTIPELKHALKRSLEKGLQVAVFNSCDGLGLAQSLSELHIPQVLVMREPVPDLVAQEFLKSFLEAFAKGESFYLSVRTAREKLQGLEGRYPCATWLPTIFQNPAALPPTWSDLINPPRLLSPTRYAKITPKRQRRLLLFTSLLVGFITLSLRQLGMLQSWELQAYDRMMSWRPDEGPDPRLVIVTVTERDVQQQDSEERRGSLSDATLSALLTQLESMQPRAIGLDIYRPFSVRADRPQLIQQLAENNLIAVCKVSVNGKGGIMPPPEIADSRVGFSDVVRDSDQTVRRQLLAMPPEPASPCQANYGFAAILALHYLAAEDIAVTTTAEGLLRVGDVVFEPIETNFGGYRGIDARGHQIVLNYRSLADPAMIADRVTLGDVLEGRVSARAVRDRIVLIGTTDRSYGDLLDIPPIRNSDGDELAGVFMQAHMTSQILSTVLDERRPISAMSEATEVAWIVIWTALGGAISALIVSKPLSRGTLVLVMVTVAVAELSLFIACWQLLLHLGYWVPWVPCAIAIPLVVGMTFFVTVRSAPQTD